ncbi:PA2169 family four-helix-bundle protein [Dyella acidiphila]|uniref:PA2169 family four-helix-bundle protein n=1 Tax=Dyella acidiphila TaxID=2775866 RepID=A0ABR9GBY4_9GAMM|nr:PA2169 family four-helix-bundle protein [Dyella acidiphila]MBE1161528.1 PA2169 family four-helix-bundle protein [Dyella acidiphila]
MADPESDIGILTTLIDATTVSADAYQGAAAYLEDEDLRNVFLQRATERKIIATNLLEQLDALGGTPEAGATSVSAYRVFNDLPGAARAGRPVVIEEVRSGEKRLRALYQEVIDNSALSALSLPVVHNACDSLLDGIDGSG